MATGGGRVVDIVVEASERRRAKRALARKKKAAALFRVWHGVREMMQEAERLRDRELLHFLAVTQLLVEERATSEGTALTAFEQVDTSLPN
ncbi:MAG: hypothetical protein JOY64_24890 [Alphaproteobacteria bacterium]|nr:hypothetical protein [Alphaproteobacteria bacterium]MBV8410888.1 hypothetical protein [Alphaproteobacteria bacterium]